METIRLGDALLVIKEGRDPTGAIWFLVRSPSGQEGWVASWLLSFGDRKWVVTDEDYLNLREGPGMSFSVISQLPQDTVLFLFGEEADEDQQVWYEVETPAGESGWVASWYVRSGRLSPPPPIPVEIESPQGNIILNDIYYHWARENIVEMVRDGLVFGYPDATFRPDSSLSRAEFYTLLIRFKKIPPESPPTPSFEDLSPDHWGYPYMETAKKAGYLGFSQSAQIEPDLPITRGEIVLAAIRALNLESVALSRADAFVSFTDTIPSSIAPFLQVGCEASLVKGYPDGTFRLNGSASRAEALTILERMKSPSSLGTIYLASKRVPLSPTVTVTVLYAQVDLTRPNIQARVFIARDQIGRLESLGELAGRNKVTVALAGAYFDKKSSDPLDPEGPCRYIWGNLENDGTFIALTNQGTSIGFSSTNDVFFAPLEVGITGRILPENLDGRGPDELSFYISGLNQPLLPDSVRLFTPIYGDKVRVGEAKAIVFRQYRVIEIKSGDVEIPRDGFVLTAPAGSWLYAHFRVGDRVELQYKYLNNVTKLLLPWQEVKTTISGGPRLLKAGQVVLHNTEENFDASLLATSARRNAIGLVGSRIIVLATVMEPVTLEQMAQIMRNLGCLEAVNLDGGASAGLYYRGEVVAQPKGSLTNIIAFTEY